MLINYGDNLKINIIIILFVLISTVLNAKPNYQKAAQILYPGNNVDQELVVKVFEMLKLHENKTPFFKLKGPFVSGFNLNNQPIALIANDRESLVDLVFLNWKKDIFDGLQSYDELSRFLEKPVYILKDVDKKSISAQGEGRGELFIFSYVYGSSVRIKQSVADGLDLSKFSGFTESPFHSEYMKSHHPLRLSLDDEILTILSPSETIFYSMFGNIDRLEIDKLIDTNGGFFNVTLGMMAHESYHAKSGIDKAQQNVPLMQFNFEAESLIQQLKNNLQLRALFGSYISLIFQISSFIDDPSKHLDTSYKNSTKHELLSDLRAIISELKNNYHDAWTFIWMYEYEEGFAEYASAWSMINIGIISLKEEILFQKDDPYNNFTYRTGAIAGLYLYYKLKNMPFIYNKELTMSVWEIIISEELDFKKQITPKKSIKTIDEILKRDYSIVIDIDDEIDRIIEFLEESVLAPQED